MTNNNYLPTDFQTFIALSRYARWLPEEGRRENWGETTWRYISNIVNFNTVWDGLGDVQQELHDAILSLEVMPSMRAMMTAGQAANRDNTCMYNCSYLPVDDPKSFDEAMFILLCGTGVGFSVERQYISKLPEVPDTLYNSDTVIAVKDSKEGWAKAYRQLLSLLWAGEVPKWDVSKVRPAGAKLKTFGGRASGPAPLVDLFRFTIDKFKGAAGRRLSSIECHDIMCKIGEVVVVGGVRRSAMISLSNLSDDRMRHAKSGQWWEHQGQRALANNSVAYTEKPDVETFMREWTALIESKSGERGIFNRVASQKQAAKNGRRESNYEFGTNPCSEIILRPYQFCNLTEVVVRATDTLDDLERKVRLATILGTIQSTYTHFPYLRKIWQKNTEEERLLGVSLTGIMDNPLMTSH
jgi:ribonucleoside-diphosphate reductase alpha chain